MTDKPIKNRQRVRLLQRAATGPCTMVQFAEATDNWSTRFRASTGHRHKVPCSTVCNTVALMVKRGLLTKEQDGPFQTATYYITDVGREMVG